MFKNYFNLFTIANSTGLINIVSVIYPSVVHSHWSRLNKAWLSLVKMVHSVAMPVASKAPY